MEKTTLYDAYRKASSVGEDEYVTIKDITRDGKTYRVYMTKKKARRLTVVNCAEPNVIEWRRLLLFPGLRGEGRYEISGSSDAVFRERIKPEKDVYTVFVINGKPRAINNLDSGLFRSASHPGDEGHVHVMSMKRFKTFDI